MVLQRHGEAVRGRTGEPGGGDETGQGGGARLEGGEHEGCLVEHSHTAGVVHALILPYRMVRRKCYALQAPQDGRTTDLETTSEER